MDDLKELLRSFSNAAGPSGFEGEARDLLRRTLEPLVDEVEVDVMGNVIATRRGDGPRVMIAAHMDEIGVMVRYVDEQGFLRFVPIGGWFDQTILAQRVLLHGRKGKVPGVIGSKPPHMMEEEDRKKPVKLRDMFIDIGATSAEDAADLGVEIGTIGTMDRHMTELANRYVAGKAFDDRAGVVMMVSALQRLHGRDVPATVYAVGTVQEEVGLKGARTAAFGLEPDVALVSETTIPGDHPEIRKELAHLETGKGPAITVADADGRGVIVPQRVLSWLRTTADAASIPYQLDLISGGTTDASAIHLTRSGIPAGVVSVPTRYLHSPIETLCLDDLDRGAELIAQAVLRAPEYFTRQKK